jgi:hypothetical protein
MAGFQDAALPIRCSPRHEIPQTYYEVRRK